MGSLISFELARYLRSTQQNLPEYLFVSGYSAPQIIYPGPLIHHLSDDEFIQAMRNFNGTSEDVLQHSQMMQLLLPTLRADFTICETYVYKDEMPLDCSISVFGGQQDHTVSYDALMAWSVQTSRFFDLHMFSGNHFFLHPARMQLLQKISEKLLYE